MNYKGACTLLKKGDYIYRVVIYYCAEIPDTNCCILLISSGLASRTKRGVQSISDSEAIAQADSLLESGQIKEAISLLHTICDANESDADAWYKLGMAYVRKQDAVNARTFLYKASELARNNYEIQSHYANLLALTNDVNGAIKTMRHFLVLDPASTEANLFLGRLLASNAAYGEALLHIQEAIVQNSKLASAHVMLAQVYAAMNNIDAARHAANDALTHDPGNKIASQILTQLDASKAGS